MVTLPTPLSQFPLRLGGTPKTYPWTYQAQTHSIVYETLGDGPPVLLLTAMSTVSTRAEMAGIAQCLAPHFQVTALDWLGFGDSARPAVQYGRSLFQQLLQDFVQACCPQPVAIVAAGHGAGYALQFAQAHPEACSKLVLVAPTWQGPFNAMGASKTVATGVRNLVRSPILGHALYALNTQPSFLKLMYQRHVYVDLEKLTSEFIANKYEITQHSGARFAPAAFVTGALDPMGDREEWLRVGRSLQMPVMAILADKAPPHSKGEMEAFAALPQVQHQQLPGSLGLYEEFAAEVGAIALNFLQ
jgi:pimeloyl-ACP methyl ester carboxylesterase